ncbi:MAG TPA: hypothetical protein VFJ82_03510 [Longimicrobium sp.]|nr:hypothetical protein [Longimicrobium sp.]
MKMRNDCRLAAQVLTTGHPAPRLEWARGFIGYCGNGAWAVATRGAILRLRTSSDDAELGRQWRFVWMIRDADLFATVVDIARDRSASTTARLWALKTLATYIDPGGNYFLNPPARANGAEPRCIAGRFAGAMHSYAGKPLPANFAAQVRDAAQPLAADATQPDQIRNAARCVNAAPVYAEAMAVDSGDD